MTTHHVSIGEVVATKESSDVIRMIGLGSCAGVFLVFPGIFGVAAHVLLPERPEREDARPGKYADTAIPYLIELTRRAGIRPGSLKATVVGGAQVFQFSGSRPELEVGARNTTAVLQHLRSAGIRVHHEDIGGTKARSITVPIATGVPE